MSGLLSFLRQWVPDPLPDLVLSSIQTKKKLDVFILIFFAKGQVSFWIKGGREFTDSYFCDISEHHKRFFLLSFCCKAWHGLTATS